MMNPETEDFCESFPEFSLLNISLNENWSFKESSNTIPLIEDIYSFEEKQSKEYEKDISLFFKNQFKNKESIEISTIEKSGIAKEKETPTNVENLLGNKRGRRKFVIFKKEGENHHDKYDIDNIITVVQVHYFNFIVNFVNYVLKIYKIEGAFNKIAYEVKKVVNNKKFNELKRKCLYEILLMKDSPKCTKSLENHNQILYEKIKDIPVIKEILNLNYLNFFRDVYYKSERNILLKLEGKDILFELSDEKLAMYKERIASFSDINYITRFEKYVKDKYFEN